MLRGAQRLGITTWRGLNSYNNLEALSTDQWSDNSNVIVNAQGNPEVLRSPKTFGDTSATGSTHSLVPFVASTGAKVIFSKTTVTYKISTAGTVTSIRTGENGAEWSQAVIADALHRTNGHEFVQLRNDFATFYRNGIDPPASAPTISYAAGGSGTISSGVTVSYAYRNSTTGHVSRPSPVSNNSGATGANHKLRIPTVASAQTGVDTIVFFITLDGGSVRYSLIDSTGALQTVSNATTNNDIDISTIFWDTLTTEPVNNYAPPTDSTSMFTWKDRIFLLRSLYIQYSGYESIGIGQPWESWPTLNIYNIPNREDTGMCGVGTQVGALVLGQRDAYLISGFPSDKTSSPNNANSITEHLEPMKWGIGTLSKKSIQYSPFGVWWIDQTARVRLWALSGFPQEVAVPLRTELNKLTLSSTEGRWFQHAKNGGYYVITDGTYLLIITVYQGDDGNMVFGFAKSDISASTAGSIVWDTGAGSAEHFYFGKNGKVYEIFAAQAGDGWGASQSRYFEQVINNDGTFGYFHTLALDGPSSSDGLTVTIKNPDGSEVQSVVLEDNTDTGGMVNGLLDAYGRRKIIRFEWDSTDTATRSLKSYQLFFQQKQRVI